MQPRLDEGSAPEDGASAAGRDDAEAEMWNDLGVAFMEEGHEAATADEWSGLYQEAWKAFGRALCADKSAVEHFLGQLQTTRQSAGSRSREEGIDLPEEWGPAGNIAEATAELEQSAPSVPEWFCLQFSDEEEAEAAVEASAAHGMASQEASASEQDSGRAGAGAAVSAFADAVKTFYTEHNPEKLGLLDVILENFADDQARFWSIIQEKYPGKPLPKVAVVTAASKSAASGSAAGVGPNEIAALKARLQSFYQKYNPSKLGQVDMVAKAFIGNEEMLDEMFREKYGAGLE
jgi:hypothetical protein